MTEFPLLCIRGKGCSDDSPRETGQRAWFCPSCVRKMRENLDLIADSWSDLGHALTATEVTYREQEGKQRNGGKTHGLQLSDEAVRARTKAGEHLRFMTRLLIDDYNQEGRSLQLPQHHTIPAIAKWIANTHVDHFASHESDHIALETWDDLADLRRSIMRGAYPLGNSRVLLGFACEKHATSEGGERVPCGGELYAVTSRKADGYSDLRCTEDTTHRVPTSEWLAGSWRRRHVRDLNSDAIERLLRGIGIRHSSTGA